MLTDKELNQIDARDFRKQTGITKADYRFFRNLILRGWHPENISIWTSGCQDDKPLTLHQFCQKLRNIDVLYITRLQKER